MMVCMIRHVCTSVFVYTHVCCVDLEAQKGHENTSIVQDTLLYPVGHLS